MDGTGGMGVGMAADFVGGIMSSIAAAKEAEAMGKAFRQELQRQGKFQGQAITSFDQYLPSLGRGTADTQMAAGAATRNKAYQDIYQVPYSIQPSQLPATDQGYYNLTGQNRATLGSYGDWLHQQNIGSLREGQKLGQITNFAKGEAQVFPYRMQDAQHSWDDLAFWGGLISSIGGSEPQWGRLFGTSSMPGGGGMGGQPQPFGYGGELQLGTPTGIDPYTSMIPG